MDYKTIEVRFKEQANTFQTIKLRNEKVSKVRPNGYRLFDIYESGFVGEDGIRVVVFVLTFEKLR